MATTISGHTTPRKLKVTVIVIGWAWSNMGVFLGLLTLKSAMPKLKNKSMN